jgi:hypothetical protein
MDSRLKEDIQRLAKTRPTVGALAASPKANPVATVTGRGAVSAAAASNGGSGGIDSPLTETARTTYNTKSSDGIFVWAVPATMTFVDASSRVVVIEFNEP